MIFSRYYIRWLIGCLIVASATALGVGSYRYILHLKKETYYREASHQYDKIIRKFESTKLIAKPQANEFIEKYRDTPYAGLVQLQLAHQAVQQNQLEEAFQQLKAIQSPDRDIHCLAKQRCARILTELGRFKEALSFLPQGKDCASHQAQIEMIKGDIFYALKDKSKALKAYRNAQKILPEMESLQPLLKMKIDDLGNLPEAIPTA